MTDKLKKMLDSLPALFYGKTNITAILGAFAEQDEKIEQATQDVKKHLFIDTAEGDYLEKLGQNVGVQRPSVVSMQDPDYRKYIKLLSYQPKQIRKLIYDLVELFYGPETTHGYVRNLASEPYFVTSGSTLEISTESGDKIVITFSESDFSNPAQATASEIVAAINAQANGKVLSKVFEDRATKSKFIELYTNTIGPTGYVSVTGGDSNKFLQFPKVLEIGNTTNTKWRIVRSLSTLCLYWAGGDLPSLSEVRNEQDILILSGAQILDNNRGSFVIEEVYDTGIPALLLHSTTATFISSGLVDYAVDSTAGLIAGIKVEVSGFANLKNNTSETDPETLPFFQVEEIISPTTVRLRTKRVDSADDEIGIGIIDLKPSASVVKVMNLATEEQNTPFTVNGGYDVMFFRSYKWKIESLQRVATIFEIKQNEIVITLPVTPVVVRRYLHGSCHLHGVTSKVIKAFSRNIVVQNGDGFSNQGNFYLADSSGRVLSSVRGNYISKNGNEFTTSESLPIVGDYINLSSSPIVISSGSSVITVKTETAHNLVESELIKLDNFPILQLPPSDLEKVAATQSIAVVGQTPLVDIFLNDTSNLKAGYAVSVEGFTNYKNNTGDFTKEYFEIIEVFSDHIRVSTTRIDSLDDETGASAFVRIENVPTTEALFESKGCTAYKVDDTGIFDVGENIIISGFRLDVNNTSPESTNRIKSKIAGYIIVETKIQNDTENETGRAGLIKKRRLNVNGEFPIETADVSTFTIKMPDNSIGTFWDSLAPQSFPVTKGTGGSEQLSNSGKLRTSKGSGIILTNIERNLSYVGSYVYEPLGSTPVPASIKTKLKQSISEADNLISINVEKLSDKLPAPGYLIFDYGKKEQEGPVRFISIPNDNSIYIDPSYVFTHSHTTGSEVNFVRSLIPTQPTENGKQYAPYTTDTTLPRNTLKQLIKDAAASSVSIRFILIIPKNYYSFYDLYK
jgi:hypothetical protein